MRYLMDTNVVSDFIKNPAGRIARHIEDVGAANVCTSIIVAAEVRFRVAKKASPRLAKQATTVLEGLDIMPFAAPADAEYARLPALLERRGQPIGGNDLFVAAHALALGYCIVTANEHEFARIDGLAWDNWLL
jgi:tRNA(fMet)-specific endonuclease VapC